MRLDQARLPSVETEVPNEATGGLGELRIRHPAGTFPVTPASLISLRAIGANQQLASGIGIDWGSGSGVLSIAAAKIKAVSMVYGLELVSENVAIAHENAATNGVEKTTEFIHSDSFLPFDQIDQDNVASLKGTVQFVLANPPSSPGDDGFSFRRRVLRESREFLVSSAGVVLLSISSQYGSQRIKRLTADAPGFDHGGVLATTDWVPFDLQRPDLLECLKQYVNEERRGGLEYAFILPSDSMKSLVNAQAAFANYERTGESPLSKWQTHRFTYRG
jgi:16S rRNA G966 N2-methylase RsmD